MQLHTFQARSIAEALRLVRDELGPDASLLHTRDVGSPLLRFLGGRTIEVTASLELAAPSRLPHVDGFHAGTTTGCSDETQADRIPGAELQDFRRKIRHNLLLAEKAEPSLVEQLSVPKATSA
jgi:flagellar biosynthesis GTPase FlhF